MTGAVTAPLVILAFIVGLLGGLLKAAWSEPESPNVRVVYCYSDSADPECREFLEAKPHARTTAAR